MYKRGGRLCTSKESESSQPNRKSLCVLATAFRFGVGEERGEECRGERRGMQRNAEECRRERRGENRRERRVEECRAEVVDTDRIVIPPLQDRL